MTEERKEQGKKHRESSPVLHGMVKDAVDKAFEDTDFSCVLVRSIQKTVDKDPRTVIYHLKLLEAIGYGRVSKDGKLFCREPPSEKK